METVFEVSWDSIAADLPVIVVLAVWNLFVVLVLSKEVYRHALKKGKSNNSSIYFSRKAIHFLAGGLTAVLLPFFGRLRFALVRMFSVFVACACSWISAPWIAHLRSSS